MKKAQCYNCGKTLTYTTGIAGPSEFVKDERDTDGFDIFICGSIKSCRFKMDMNFYIKNILLFVFIYLIIQQYV